LLATIAPAGGFFLVARPIGDASSRAACFEPCFDPLFFAPIADFVDTGADAMFCATGADDWLKAAFDAAVEVALTPFIVLRVF
jgi:hypothetical protein